MFPPVPSGVGGKLRPASSDALSLSDCNDISQMEAHLGLERKVLRALRERGSRCAAMTKAATEFPTLLEKYQAEGLKLVDQSRPEPFQKADADIQWNRLVAAIRFRDGCSNADALRRAADEHPAELKAYREA